MTFFAAGKDEHTFPKLIDFDGLVYGGDTVRCSSSLSLSQKTAIKDDSLLPDIHLHAYRTYEVTEDSEEQLREIQAAILDDDGNDLWVNLTPEQARQIGEWFINEADRQERETLLVSATPTAPGGAA